MRASDYTAAFLAQNGVTTVYEMTGGMITFLLDSIGAREDMTVVSMHHEQAAAFAAEAGARLTGVPGVALATSGPGATNLVTGIGSCFFDSVPAVFITGQVNTNELSGDSGVRQAGFQETDIVAVATPLTKWAVQVRSAKELPAVLAKAFATAREGRPGPVLVDIPMNVQRCEIDAPIERVTMPTPDRPADIAGVFDALLHAEHPLILAGGGVRTAGAAGLLREFAETAGIPVASTLMGLDVLPNDSALRVGMIGTYGNRWANLALRDADCILALGARLDVRQTGADVAAFRAGRIIIKVDVDASQLSWRLRPDIAVASDVGAFLEAALCRVQHLQSRDWTAWLRIVEGHRRAWPDTAELAVEGVNPAAVMHALSAVARDASVVVTDVGQNQMWAAQSIRLGEGQRLLTSGGMGAMGFALPAAVGAALSHPGHPVFAVIGDGGMQVNIQELETIERLGLPIKMVVINNSCLGMVRQLQDELFASRYQSTVWGYGAPDFVAIAQAYHLPARRVSEPDEVDAAMDWLAANPKSAALLEVKVGSGTCVRPKVTFGNPIYVMDPPPDQGSHCG